MLKFTSRELIPLLEDVNKEWYGGKNNLKKTLVYVENPNWFYDGHTPSVVAELTDYNGEWGKFWSLRLKMAENRDVKIIGGLNKEFASLNLNDWGARQKIEDTIF